ncbi:MAG: adenylate/guanylate cyclase domain-containing protein [Planctomycetota bacterium]
MIKNTGDGILALFHSAVEAADFAMSLHKESGHATVRVRVGIHVGRVNLDGDDAFGRLVNLTARIMTFAKADGVIASNRAKEDIVRWSELHTRQFRWTEFHAVVLKGFPEPLTLWQVDR